MRARIGRAKIAEVYGVRDSFPIPQYIISGKSRQKSSESGPTDLCRTFLIASVKRMDCIIF